MRAGDAQGQAAENLDTGYKRGAVMGLTVAEAFILLSFCLMLLFTWWQVEAEERQDALLESFGDLTPEQKQAILSVIDHGSAAAMAALAKEGDLARAAREKDLTELIPALALLPEEQRKALADMIKDGTLAEVIEKTGGGDPEALAALARDKELATLVSKNDLERIARGLVQLPPEQRQALTDLVESRKVGTLMEAADGMEAQRSTDQRLAQATRRLEETAANQKRLIDTLEERLGATIREAGGEISADGTISLPQSVLFDVNQDRIKDPEFLASFCRPWLATLQESGIDISELKIEGHASSEGPPSYGPEASFLYNLDLSQRRAQNALRVCLDATSKSASQDWARQHLAAVGYSSTRLVTDTEGNEDRERSRRVMFSVTPDQERLIEEIGRDLNASTTQTLPAETEGSGIIGVPRIIDGDTLEVSGTRIRLFGIDAPEMSQTCGVEDNPMFACGKIASDWLKEEIGSREVECQPSDTDVYGRTVATCFVAGKDIAENMVASGYAAPFVRYTDRYVEMGRAAEQTREGLWAVGFEPPWEFRAGR
jgi:endonuclease YncB( thermonuclease family)/outer membrane protein OmpA-like peptidoglycan-associated protein